MAQYRYRALDHEGNAIEDTIEAPSAHRATAILKERGLNVSSVVELAPPPTLLRVSRQLTWDELRIFVEQLMAVVRSGLPLAPALHSLAQDLRKPRLKAALERLRLDIEHGSGLDEALERQPKAFPSFFVSAVRAGEKSGNLAGVLQLLCRHAARVVQMRQTLRVALAYPVTVTIVACFVIVFLLLKVVPVFGEIFSDFDSALPAPTRVLLSISEFLRYETGAALSVLPIAVGAFIIIWIALRRTDSGCVVLDWLRMHVPLYGTLNYCVALARFCRTLEVLLAARAPIIESLELAAAASASPILERAVGKAILLVASGERVADALSSTGFFGHSFCWTLGTSESRGELERALGSLAETYEREVALRDRMSTAMISPVMVFVVALLVGSIVVALYLPIFTLGDAVSGV